MTPQTEQQREIHNLVVKIRELKALVDIKYHEELTVKENMNNFLAQYQSYLGELDKQVDDFSGKIFRARKQIELLNRRLESPTDEQKKSDDFSNTQSKSDELVGSVDPDLTDDSNVKKQDEILTEEIDGTLNPDEKIKKEETRKHFARFWHPDYNNGLAIEDVGFMTVLNTAFNESRDLADMLAAIPWDDKAWEQPKGGESIGDQWVRLIDWLTALQVASKRLDQKLASVKIDWRYPVFSDWDKDSEKHIFFTSLADSKRDEIKRMEETLVTLQQEVDNLKIAQSE